MYTLMLSALQLETLVDVLECAISELHTEIVHTDRCEYKDDLKNRKQILLQLLDSCKQLEQVQPA